MKSKIFYAKPSITELEIRYAADAVSNGWGENCYDYLNRFEESFGRHLGVKFSIATSSCTGALHLGMAALGIGPGDEVILADTNWIATAAPIVHLGATPIFVDILPDTWCLNPELVEAAITPRTKAIIAVHLYGNLCDMERLVEIGNKYGVAIIEDAAEAIGSIWLGRRAGSIGRFGVFSFHGSKTMTTGEGGAFVTNDPFLYEKVLTLSNHGRSQWERKQFWPSVIGYKFKMSNVQAAIGCAQLSRLDSLIARKREIFAAYKSELEDLSGVDMNPEHTGTTNGYWMPTVVFSYAKNELVSEHLLRAFREENIDARSFFWPLSNFEFFKNYQVNSAVSKSVQERAINLPSYHDLSEEEIHRVVRIVRALRRRLR